MAARGSGGEEGAYIYIYIYILSWDNWLEAVRGTNLAGLTLGEVGMKVRQAGIQAPSEAGLDCSLKDGKWATAILLDSKGESWKPARD